MKYLFVEFGDGKQFKIPANIIARDVARQIEFGTVDIHEWLRNEACAYTQWSFVQSSEFEQAFNDEAALIEHARRFMDWSDLELYAEEVNPDPQPDYSALWYSAKKEIKNVA